MDYEFIQVKAFDGTARKEAAIEVFSTATGNVITICRRAYIEPKQAWIDRALAQALAA